MLFLSPLILFVLWANTAGAETPVSPVICDLTYGWMNNSLPVPQTPCLVAAYLEGACGTGYWNVPLLPVGQSYNGPNINQTNICLCSTVVYNAISACGACQDESWITWPNWKLNCDASLVTVGTYKFPIPSDTAVPKWLYQDPTQQVSQTFNVTMAKAQAGLHLPDITASNQASTEQSSSSKKTNIGPIVGGVVGGVAVLVLAGFAVWYFVRMRPRSRASSAPSNQYINKWSKGVINAPPSRWGHTSHGGSVMGDSTKERDGMMVSMGTPSESVPYATDGHSARYKSRSPDGSGAYRNSAEVMPSSPSPGYGFPQPAPSTGRASHGHRRDPSGTRGSRSKLFAPHSNVITPFILPPAGQTSPPPENRSTSNSSRTGTHTPFSITGEQSTTAYSPRSSQNAVQAVLPSNIEYLGDRRPPVPPSTLPAINGSANVSHITLSSNRPGYYNPDDPSTFPLAEFYAPTSSRRHSQEGTALGSSAFMPNTPLEKVPTTPATGGHSLAYGRNLAPLNMDMSLAGSVHTLPYSASSATPADAPGPSVANAPPRSRPLPVEPVQASASPPQGTSLLSSWRRARGGSNDAGEGRLGSDGTWSPHVPTTEAEMEFDPWSRT